MSKTQDPERRVPALHVAHVLPEVSARTAYWITAPVGVLPDDLCKPEFWKHIVSDMRLKRHDGVKAVCVDDSWYAEYLVLHVGAQSATLKLLKQWSLTDETLVLKTATHEVKWISPSVRYGVRRLSDNETIRDGFETKDIAAAWMHQNLKDEAA